MKYLIIGASGLVGSNIASYIADEENDVVGTHLNFSTLKTVYFNAINLDDDLNFDALSFKPDIIIHCGALTFVDYCELHPLESYNNTVYSAINVINLCKKVGGKLVYISTDYVFDGINGPYGEEMTRNPLNTYGRHKMEAENYVMDELKNFIILRITNVYGDEIRNKNFIARLIQNINMSQSVDMVLPFDQYATPVNALDIAKAIKFLVEKGCTGIYHIASTDYFNRHQLFMKVLEYFPKYTNYKFKVTTTADLNPPAKRPLLGGFTSAKFLSERPNFLFSNVDQYLKRVSGNQ